MDCGYLLQNNFPVAEKLTAYGFTQQGDGWHLERTLPFNNLVMVVDLIPPQFIVRVIDQTFNDDFLPFEIKGGTSPIKAAVDELLNDMVATCFTNPKRELIAHCENTYHTLVEQPWEKFPEYYTFKTAKRQKWYAVILRIPCQKIGFTGTGQIDIVNVKLPPEQIPTLIDGRHYFASYHMDKRYWLTIVLNQDTDWPQVKRLLDQSYQLVENAPKGKTK